MNRIFQQAYHIPGTLAANIDVKFKLPCDAQLLHLSAVASNDSDATMKVGYSSDDDEYLAGFAIGQSGVPEQADGDDWTDANGDTHDCYYPHIAAGTTISFYVDYDGAAGTPADDLTVVLTFAEG